MEKKQPFNLEAEQAVLGGVFINNSIMTNVIDRMEKDDFYDERNKIIFLALSKLHNENSVIDYATVVNSIENIGSIDSVGGKEYILALADATPSSANIDAYIDIVKDTALKRKIIITTQDIQNKGFDGNINATDYIDYAERVIFEASKSRKTSEFSTIKEIANFVYEKTEINMKNQEEITGLDTGFAELNKYTLGFQPQQLIILAARPSMGKSTLALNFASSVAARNKNGKATVAIFSLEMASDQIVMKMLANESTINSNDIKKGSLTPQQWRYLAVAVEKISKLNIHFSDVSNVTISEMRAKCRKLSQSQGLDMIVIDYLQLITGEGKTGNRQEEVSNISRSLKQLARELNVPIVALSQLSRSVDQRDNKRPVMSDLRESGGIEQDADIVLFLYRDWYYNKACERPNVVELSIAKNREGTSGRVIELLFEPEYSRFKNIEKTE